MSPLHQFVRPQEKMMQVKHLPARWPARLTMTALLLLTLLITWPTSLMPELAAPVAAAFPGKNGLIAFGSARGVAGNPGLTQIEIFALDPTTQQVTRLTDNAVNDYGPAWSADGRKITFTRWWLDVGYSIWVMDADGRNQTKLLDGGTDEIGAPAWSPDGRKIAFSRATGGARDSLDIMDANGANVRTVVTMAGAGDPSWSPDGSKITFTGNRYDFRDADVYTVRPDGSNVQNLTPGDSWCSDPEWSPDGRKIVCYGFNGVPSPETINVVDILVMNANGSGVVNLTGDLEGKATVPAWSPDGRQILFQGRLGPTSPEDQIISMNADGTHKTALANGTNTYGLPAWQPKPAAPRPPIGVVQFPKPTLIKTDLIAFSSNRKQPNNPEGDYEIFVMALNPVTSTPQFTQLTMNTVDEQWPKWSPDGAQIAFERQGQIWRMNRDGGNQVNLTGTAGGNGPAWSANGAKIAFVQASDIFTMNADGSSRTNLTNGALGGASYLDWSPDGAKLVFSNGASGGLSISLLNADGSNLRTLFSHPTAFSYTPVWSPDGTKIAFASWRDGPGISKDIFTMDADGSHVINRTRSTADDWMPSWSPDSTRLVFMSGGDLLTMKANGTSVVNRTTGQDNDLQPDWSPKQGTLGQAARAPEAGDDPRHETARGKEKRKRDKKRKHAEGKKRGHRSKRKHQQRHDAQARQKPSKRERGPGR